MSGKAEMLTQAVAHAGEETRTDRWFRRFVPVAAVLCIGVFVGAVAFALAALWSAWQTASWDDYFAQLLTLLPGIVLLWRLPELLDRISPSYGMNEAARELRLIAIQGDERLAPRVDPQPEALEALQDAGGESLSIRLSNPPVALFWIMAGLLTVLGLMGAGTIALTIWLIAFLVGTQLKSPIEGWGLALIAAILLVMLAAGIGVLWLAAHFLMRLRRERYDNRYTVDAWGLRRGEGKGQLLIPWHEAQAFYQFAHYRPTSDTLCQSEPVQRLLESGSLRAQRIVDQLTAVTQTPTTTSYVLDAGKHILTWTVRAHESATSAASYTQVWRVIVTYAHAPLRDLSEPVHDLLQTVARTTKESSHYRAPEGRLLPLDSRAGPVYSTFRRVNDWTKRSSRALFIAPLALLLVLYGGGWGLQHLQLAQYASLPARIHAEKPLFTDALATDDGAWPVGTDAPDDMTYSYVNGAYQISGDGGEALANRTFGDAAVEVTVRQTFTNPNLTMGQLGEIGLVVRAGSNPDHFVTFTIGPLGDWALMRYEDTGNDANDWKALALGQHSSAVHDGFVPNRLLVLMRGSEYICYVNGQLVAIAHDDALRQGRVGLWLDDNTTVGHYSQFAVYPTV